MEGEPGLGWRSPTHAALRTAIMAVEVSGRSAPELGGTLLADHGAEVRAFGGPLNTLRLSPNVLTQDDEIDYFLDLLVEAGE
ncbi:MAG: hypothetical protein O2956_09720 [Gemmatimonadetes bacterium]|nr:hypothetical protein [Gemmatimonadota bacterium]